MRCKEKCGREALLSSCVVANGLESYNQTARFGNRQHLQPVPDALQGRGV
jgi:hypothetical protein